MQKYPHNCSIFLKNAPIGILNRNIYTRAHTHTHNSTAAHREGSDRTANGKREQHIDMEIRKMSSQGQSVLTPMVFWTDILLPRLKSNFHKKHHWFYL